MQGVNPSNENVMTMTMSNDNFVMVQSGNLSHTMGAIPLAHWVSLSHDGNYPVSEWVPLYYNDSIPITQWVPLSHMVAIPLLELVTSLTQWWLSPSQNWYLFHTMVAIPLAEWVPP